MTSIAALIPLLSLPALPFPGAEKAGAPEPALQRIAVVGASVSDGHGTRTSLAEVLDAAILPPHRPVADHSTVLFFAIGMNQKQKLLEEALQAGPTLVVAADFLFWYGYGKENRDGQPLKSENERLELLEVGLKLLEGLPCPLVIGDLPDMSHAVGKILIPAQLPGPETLRAINLRIHRWAGKRKNVILLPLADLVRDLRSNKPVRIGKNRWPAGSAREVFQEDDLHLTLHGLVVLEQLVADSLIRNQLASSDLLLDPAAVKETVEKRIEEKIRHRKAKNVKKTAVKETAVKKDMKLWKVMDLEKYPAMFPSPGDLDGDGKVDFLLYRQGPQTAPGYLVAIDFHGKKLWELGDPSLKSHSTDGIGKEPALRGIALVYDIDQDGSQEVITEFWERGKPMLYILDGKTGRIERSRPSPFDLQVRGGRRSRCHPLGRIAWLEGRDRPPALVLKYEASNNVPCHAAALDSGLNILWRLTTGKNGMGHIPTVGDVDGDGRDEAILGTTLVDDDGRILWERKVSRHADCTSIADVHPAPGKEVLLSICGTGPAYCLSAAGEVLWEKTRQEVPHGQGIWAGNFIPEEPGLEVIILKSGHVGDFVTVRGSNGTPLAAFRHRKEFQGYPDFPQVVNWRGKNIQSLWIPIDRALVDGRGEVVAGLGKEEDRVAGLRTTKDTLAVQAIPLDLCGDEREELILYQPYRGKAILIFTQPDSGGEEKQYVHQRNAYNLRTYF